MPTDTIPKVSVIIPLYNKAPYIRRALDSVLAQTVQDFEIVVVNDGSTDGSEKIVAEYTDARIRLINQENQGVSAARNQGVDAARAELVAFLDADDEWLPEFLETILYLQNTYPHGGIFATNYIIIQSSYNHKKMQLRGIDANFEGEVKSIFRVAALNRNFPGMTSSTAIPKQIYLDEGGFRVGEIMAEDLDLWARISLKYPYIFTTEAHAVYHHDKTNNVTYKLDAYISSTHPFLASIKTYPESWLKEKENYTDILLYLEGAKLSNLRRDIVAGKKKDARKELKQIQHKELQKEKFTALFASYMPQKLLLLAVKKIWHMK